MPDGDNSKPTIRQTFVTVESCQEEHKLVEKKLEKLDLALFGLDGRGGIVADIQSIKSSTSTLKAIILPVVIAVTCSVITAGIFRMFG